MITGFPGETERDHADTLALVEELPFTYLHVFPFSPRDGTVAEALNREMPVPQRVAGERSRELRDLVRRKGDTYRSQRSGGQATVVVEGKGTALTEDYLRVRVDGPPPGDAGVLHTGVLKGDGPDLYIALNAAAAAAPPTTPRSA